MSRAKTTNVAALLARREAGCGNPGACARGLDHDSVKRKLEQWQEADFLKNCSAEYASFQPAPRSTIALCYNCDGSLLASTHGDHTVKVTSCHTGRLARVLNGHRRTPWVVRFHPRLPHLLASGSLDHEVRLWDAHTGQCVARHTFGKPIASLAFHVSAGVLAIGCGHKLYTWQYDDDGAPPVIVLKTRRSMRAVHFHPHGLPLVLTAEVQDPSPTADLAQTLTEQGPYCPGAWEELGAASATAAAPARAGEGSSGAAAQQLATQAMLQALGEPQAGGQARAEAVDLAPGAATGQEQRPAAHQQQQHPAAAGPQAGSMAAAIARPLGALTISPPLEQRQAGSVEVGQAPGPSQPVAASRVPAAAAPGPWPHGSQQLPPSMVPVGWEVPFPANFPFQVRPPGLPSGGDPILWMNPQLVAAINASVWNIIGEEQPPRVRLRLWRFDASKPAAELDEGASLRVQLPDAVLCSEMGVHFSPCGRYLAATVACRGPLPTPSSEAQGAATAAAGPGSNAVAAGVERGQDRPPGPSGWQRTLSMLAGSGSAALAPAAAAATLGSEPTVGGHASRMIAECVPDAGAMPHPSLPERVVFEVRVFTMEGARFGEVVQAKRIRAAHCLTSVQFSPACDHVLLAYGKKHSSLLRSLVADRGALLPMHTILEVYRLQDMALVRVLPSAEDEINAACFHPAPGGGIAYGTKEGRLRVLAHDRGAHSETGPSAPGEGPHSAPTARELQALQDFALMQQAWVEQHAAGA